MPNNSIFLVEKDNIVELRDDQVSVDLIGGKAFGLCQVPQAWSVPFFIISKELFSEYVSNKEKSIIGAYINNIKAAIMSLGMKNGVILRSSAVNEGMRERGKFDSIETTLDNIENALFELLDKLKDIPNEGMPILVQELIESEFTGHMSNERRFSQENRDWKVEIYKNDGSFEQDTIGVRTWRIKLNIEEIINIPLSATTKTVTSELLKVAFYWYTLSKNMKCRFHLEFVFNGRNIYIVQADRDYQKENAINPKDYDITIKNHASEWNPKVLKKYDLTASSNYKKLQNVKDYHDLGFCTVPLYYLDNKNVILDLKEGKVSEALEQDLQTLLSIQSLVIRMDLNSVRKAEKQMLPRSNEIFVLEDVISWLKENANKISEEQEGIFIFHNFVPATASAFAHAIPNGRLVKIQSLWGLPEGLYYNYHDTIIVDLGSKNLDYITESDAKVTVKNKYKDLFVCPGKDGMWLSQDIKEPYDWRCSIENNRSILEIAIKSQKLANKLKKEISVMWFVGIDSSFYGASNLPWFHESVSFSSYTTDEYKRKYFKEEEKIINNSEELQKLIDTGDVKDVKCFRLKPNCDKDLRNKDLIRTIGTMAAQNDIMILLDGTQLTHSYYQLKNTGAKVVCSDKDELLYSDTLEFNKLVRDKIPEKIIANGEHIKCSVVARPLLDRLLLEKLLEEAFEVNDSATPEETVSELADLTEICNSLLELSLTNPISHRDILNNKRKEFLNEFKELASITIPINCSEYKKTFKLGNNYGYISIQRQKTLYKVEFNIQNYLAKTLNTNKTKENKDVQKCKKSILEASSKSLNCKNPLSIVRYIKQIQSYAIGLCYALGVSADDVEEKRESKASKVGGFAKGYVLNQTILKDNIIDELLEFDPNNCNKILEIDRENYKYFELLQNQEKKEKRLLFRFSMPIAANEWEIVFDNSKICELVPSGQKIKFEIQKNNSGRLKLNINLQEVSGNKQLSFEGF